MMSSSLPYTDNGHDLLLGMRHLSSYDVVIEKAEKTIEHMKDLLETLPLFQLFSHDEDLSSLEKIALDIRSHFTDVLILGTGGSSLGGQALYELSDEAFPRLHFHDNIDPHTFRRLFNQLSPDSTAVIAISKSGNTAETLMQLLVCLDHWQKHMNSTQIAEHFFVISEKSENAIREVARYHNILCLDHPSQIGGRFAVFTVVGMLPALISGLNATAIRKGACAVLNQLKQISSIKDSPPLRGAFLSYLLSQSGCKQSVLMPYVDRLSIFSFWYRQLWAESLGKKGQGTTPINALGTVDQHSQLQLYLDGPNDKFFTVVTMPHSDCSFKTQASLYSHSAVSIFQGKTMGQLMMAEQQATIDTLIRYHCPTRVMTISKLDEFSMGALMMHFILETLAMAHLLDVNPFDQPAVEDGKILTRQYLADM